MTTKTNKAKTVKTLLRRGFSTKDITDRMAVSPSYVWLLKKQMAEEKAEENDDNVVRPRVVSTHPTRMRRVTKEHAEHLMELNRKERAEQLKELDREEQAKQLKELAYQMTRGRQAYINDVDATLTERGEDYGNYANKAVFIQEVKYFMRSGPSWDAMDPDMRESMDMIAHKMGRIAYGDPSHLDSWIDIAGYAKLVADRLQGNAR